jgi:GTP-binding protein
MMTGESSGYAMAPLQARGTLFITPQTQGQYFVSNILEYAKCPIVYPGMIIGESSKSNDLYLNPCIKKQLTNIRAAAADEKIVLASPRTLTLEEALSYMADDELVEITPKNVRLRKKDLGLARKGGKGKKS